MKNILIATIAIVTILVIATFIAIHAVFSDKKDIDEVDEVEKDGTDIVRGADHDIDKIFMSQQHIHMS